MEADTQLNKKLNENQEQLNKNPSDDKSRTPKIKKTREIIKKLPEHKAHIEVISAILTIPVLITVLLLNISSLRTRNVSPTSITSSTITPTSFPSPHQTAPTSLFSPLITGIPVTATPQPSNNQSQCVQGIGPIDIAYPQEGQNVSNNPLCITINYNSENFCPVVWAYSINGSPLSDYSNNSVCLYNLPTGNNSFTLQVKSLGSDNTTSVTRHFIYTNPNNPSITPSLSPTSGATSSAQNQ